MSQNPSKYYFYIAIAIFFAVSLVWIIQDSNNANQKNHLNDSATRDSLNISDDLDSLRTELIKYPDDADLNGQMANMLFDIQKYNEAIIYYRKTLLAQPDFISAQIDLSICYYSLKIIDTALVEMENALKIDSGHLKGLFNMGVMYYNTGQVDSAIHYWKQLLNQHPDSREAEVARGILNKLNT